MRLFLVLMFISMSAFAEKEKYYADIFCEKMGGVSESRNSDGTRTDCLTDEYAIEVDWAHKWYNGVGQSLHYATVTGKKPAVALIVNEDEQRFVDRLERLHVCPKIKFFRIEK